MEAHQNKFLNDFVCFNLRESILKRFMNNDIIGSSWHFNPFLYINVKIMNLGPWYEIAIKHIKLIQKRHFHKV